MMYSSEAKGRFEGNVVVGGLILCKIPTETMVSRREQMQAETDQAMEGVDNNFMRENDARMPLLSPERKTRVTFGDGS